MVKIYIVRHCEAAGNLKNAFQGHTDCDISADGEKQLEYLKERFSEIHIDKAYSSPLKRAYKTAEAAVFGKNISIIKEPRFIEINGGVIEGMPFDEIVSKYPWFFDVWDNRPWEFHPEGGEAMREVYDRVWDGIRDIAEDSENEGKTLLIASHGAVIRNLICRLTFNDIEKLCYTDWSVNTAVSLLTYKDGEFKLEYANDNSHLPNVLKKTSRVLSKKEI